MLLDALEAVETTAYEGSVWRVVRQGMDPSQGGSANGRWSVGPLVEVLYTSLSGDGALAEIGHRLSLEPVWPSRLSHTLHELQLRTNNTLSLADMAKLSTLGVEAQTYHGVNYETTQAIAAAAHFLEYDGLLVPSARHNGVNLVVFPDRLPPGGSIVSISSQEVDWELWRKAR